MLRTHSQVRPDTVHVSANVVAIDESRSRCRWKQSSQNRPTEKTKNKSDPFWLLLTLALLNKLSY